MIQQIIKYFSTPKLCVKCVYHHFDKDSWVTKEMDSYKDVAGTSKEFYIKCNRPYEISPVTGATINIDHSCEYERGKSSRGCGPNAKFYVYDQSAAPD